MNEILIAPYIEEEVKKALFQIGDLKAPGTNGLHVVFLKLFWHIISDELVGKRCMENNFFTHTQ